MVIKFQPFSRIIIKKQRVLNLQTNSLKETTLKVYNLKIKIINTKNKIKKIKLPTINEL